MTHKKELLRIVSADEQTVIRTFIDLKNGGRVAFDEMSEMLFDWSGKWIEKTKS